VRLEIRENLIGVGSLFWFAHFSIPSNTSAKRPFWY